MSVQPTFFVNQLLLTFYSFGTENDHVLDPFQDQGQDHPVIQIRHENMISVRDTGNFNDSSCFIRQNGNVFFNVKFKDHHRQGNHRAVYRKSEVAVHVIYKCRPFDMLNPQGIDLTNIANTNTEMINQLWDIFLSNEIKNCFSNFLLLFIYNF